MTFFQIAARWKLIAAEPSAAGLSMAFMNQQAQGVTELVMAPFCAEMKKRRNDI